MFKYILSKISNVVSQFSLANIAMRMQTQGCQPFSRHDPQEKEKSQNIRVNKYYNNVIAVYRNHDRLLNRNWQWFYYNSIHQWYK